MSLIANRKTVDPGDSRSPDVIQLETAMGAAVGTFEEARALVVPRARFVPVKTTDDLLVLRSDVYAMADDARIAPRDGVPFVDLDSSYFKLLDDFEERFPAGPPSLARCERLVVRGDVEFGRDVAVVGDVEVVGEGEERLRVEDGAVLEGGL